MWPFKKIAKDLYLLDQVQQRLIKKNTDLKCWINEIRSELGLEPKEQLHWSYCYALDSRFEPSLKERVKRLEEQNRLLLDYLKVKVTEIQGTPTKRVITKDKK
jgi:hypothetical protein